MPSIITYWNRLEPRPRSDEIGRSLAAQIRDPLWMLARQWQVGEFQGEDAGSPKFVQVVTENVPISHIRFNADEPLRELGEAMPIERLVEAEAFSPNLSLRVELGQTFEMMLGLESAGAMIEAFRRAYPLPTESSRDFHIDSRDHESLRFLRFCQGRALDGFKLYAAAQAAGSSLPASPSVPDELKDNVTRAIRSLQAWVAEVYGKIAETDDAPAWKPARIEYAIEAAATGPSGDKKSLDGMVFSASPGRDGDFDWFAFDLRARTGSALREVKEESVSMLPAYVQFRGMPNMRWWDFETNVTDFGAISPQKRDLAKMAMMDFMLIHGNDWFVVPLTQPMGSVCWIKEMVVRDVFGMVTRIDRADALPVSAPRERWTMFSITAPDDLNKLAPVFIIPPSPTTVAQFGPAIEEVRFLRDEMAEMVWAVERTTENAAGGTWSGHERDIAGRAPAHESPPPQTPAGEGQPEIPLIYRIETTVPENWIPFVPVSINPAEGEIRLERAAMLRDEEPVKPFGRILQPSGLPVYQVEEEEVPRAGVLVSRVLCRSRWIDGSTHIWIARRKGPGAGEGSSGLRYDLALPNTKAAAD
ncbi:MAG TPA: hypothetical protein VJ464_06950 [Blastocatellia bacterium]|nr:hypothetical protein [Blastocatellia bacterium]